MEKAFTFHDNKGTNHSMIRKPFPSVLRDTLEQRINQDSEKESHKTLQLVVK